MAKEFEKLLEIYKGKTLGDVAREINLSFLIWKQTKKQK